MVVCLCLCLCAAFHLARKYCHWSLVCVGTVVDVHGNAGVVLPHASHAGAAGALTPFSITWSVSVCVCACLHMCLCLCVFVCVCVQDMAFYDGNTSSELIGRLASEPDKMHELVRGRSGMPTYHSQLPSGKSLS